MREKCLHLEFFWSVFSGIRTEYGEILRISLYSVRMRENTDQENSEYGHFLHSVSYQCPPLFQYFPARSYSKITQQKTFDLSYCMGYSMLMFKSFELRNF